MPNMNSTFISKKKKKTIFVFIFERKKTKMNIVVPISTPYIATKKIL